MEYELTDLGRSLLVPIEALGNWAFAYVGVIETARREFDARKDKT